MSKVVESLKPLGVQGIAVCSHIWNKNTFEKLIFTKNFTPKRQEYFGSSKIENFSHSQFVLVYNIVNFASEVETCYVNYLIYG